MGCRLKSRVQCHPDVLKPSTPVTDLVWKKEKEYRKQMQVSYNHRHKATKEADELSPGDRAWLPDLRVEGKVIGGAPCPGQHIGWIDLWFVCFQIWICVYVILQYVIFE